MAVPFASAVPYALTFGGLWLGLKTLGYWFVPLLQRAQQRCGSAVPTRFAVVPDPATLDRSLQMGLNRVGQELEALGFAPSPPLRDASGALKGIVQLFAHEADGAIASIIVMPRPNEEDAYVSLFLASQAADGTRIATTNSPLPSIYPPMPKVRSARFPGETKAARLYALHKAHARTAGRLVPMKLGDAAAWQRREEERGARWWVECGYCYAQGDALRFTWKGAFLSTWRMQAPWKTRIEARNEKVRLQLLTAAGLTA